MHQESVTSSSNVCPFISATSPLISAIFRSVGHVWQSQHLHVPQHLSPPPTLLELNVYALWSIIMHFDVRLLLGVCWAVPDSSESRPYYTAVC